MQYLSHQKTPHIISLLAMARDIHNNCPSEPADLNMLAALHPPQTISDFIWLNISKFINTNTTEADACQPCSFAGQMDEELFEVIFEQRYSAGYDNFTGYAWRGLTSYCWSLFCPVRD
jgi:hypothetical protein